MFKLTYGDTTTFLPCCTIPDDITSSFGRAKLLYETVRVLPTLGTTEHTIVQRKRAGRQATSDSDDERIPDLPIVPRFNATEMAVVQLEFDKLRENYVAGLRIGFFNAVGKSFVVALGNYVNMATNNRRQYMYLQSTATGFSQPGALFMNWSLPSRTLRSQSLERIIHTNERYADCIIYDRYNCVNVVVVEVKENEEEASESQNNEQMVGLWKTGQIAMLGLEFHTNTVGPKILALIDDAMHMFYLNSLDLRDANDFSAAYNVLCYLCKVSY